MIVNDLQALDDQLLTSSYIGGHFSPTCLDSQVFTALSSRGQQNLSSYLHLSRWFAHIQSYDEIERRDFTEISAKDNKSRVNFYFDLAIGLLEL